MEHLRLAGMYLWLVATPLAAAVAAALAGPRTANRVKWACFALLFWPTALLVVYRRARGRDADGEPTGGAAPTSPPPRVEPVPAPGSDDLVDLPEPVSACPRCGYIGIRMPTLADGVALGGGEIGFHVCPRCHYRGMPLVFPTREEYGAFVRELHAAP